MKKVIKYIFMTLGKIFILGFVLLLIVVKLTDNDSGTKKELATSALSQIASFYATNGRYPKSLHDIPLYSSNQDFVNHVQKHSFQYSSDEEGGYTFSWRGGAMDWTGYSCTNYKSLHKNMSGIVRRYQTVDGSFCTVTDLH